MLSLKDLENRMINLEKKVNRDTRDQWQIISDMIQELRHVNKKVDRLIEEKQYE